MRLIMRGLSEQVFFPIKAVILLETRRLSKYIT